jgi:hypothetical protein
MPNPVVAQYSAAVIKEELPSEEKKSRDGTGMEDHHGNGGCPVQALRFVKNSVNIC